MSARKPWIVGYLRLPDGVRATPIVVTIGGLDGRKENASFRNDAYLAHGVAYFSFDMPGTGQLTIGQVAPGAEREFGSEDFRDGDANMGGADAEVSLRAAHALSEGV